MTLEPTGSNRKFPRAPVHIQVSYRTAGSFLVAYSINLSKGGLFVEAEPLPVGAEVHLELEVPGAGRLDVDGTVAWTRTENAAGLPIGMGIQFTGGIDEKHGQAIDAIISSFEGLEILLVGSMDRRALLGRYVASILSCETVEAQDRETALTVLHEGVDLAIVDLDSAGTDGMEVVQFASRDDLHTPVIALAIDVDTQNWALAHGAEQVVKAPPTFGELQLAVLAALSRPKLAMPPVTPPEAK